MGDKNNLSKEFNTTYFILRVWWILVLAIALLQLYFMSKNLTFLVLLFILPVGLNFIFSWFYKKIRKKKKSAEFMIYFLAGVHFLPLIFQILGFRNPGIDSILTGLIGFIILWTYWK